jgi:4-amino-4-deoxy-L-arabinose transferase-like glycosyltransferase
LLVILLAAVRWSLGHPYGIHWDESLYFNTVHIDVFPLKDGMLLTLAKRFYWDSSGRPPAYRLLALPLLGLTGFHPTAARLVSLACFTLSSWFIYRTTRDIASKVAGALAALVFLLSPDVVAASIFYGTDAPLYLATSAMLYFLFASWSDSKQSAKNWIGLGLAIGLGFLSKTSFLLIVVPVFFFWFVESYLKRLSLPSVWSAWKAAVVAMVVALPWWVLNFQSAAAYTRYARGFVRNSLGPPSLLTWLRWMNTAFQSLLGVGVSLLILLIVIAVVRNAAVSEEKFLTPLQQAALIACFCAGVPLVLAQLSGTNHLLRHVSPAVIPLAIAIGILGNKVEWGRSWGSSTVSGILLGGQLLMLVSPVAFPNDKPVDIGFVNGMQPWQVMSRFDQWDWSQVRDIADRCQVPLPKIAFLGSGRVFNPPSIQSPWLDRAPSNPRAIAEIPNVRWMWRYEDGPIDWQKVMAVTNAVDMVLAAPHYIGERKNKEDLDNQHNLEFLNRVSQDPGFKGPIRLELGRFAPVEMDVFVKKSLACPVGQPLPAKP